MKITDLLENNDAFTTHKRGKDPETGTVTWDVEYSTILDADKHLDRTIEALEEVSRKRPDDEKLKKFVDLAKALRKSYRMHTTRNYTKHK